MFVDSNIYEYIKKHIDIIEINGTIWVNKGIFSEQNGDYVYIEQSKEVEHERVR